MVDQTDRIGAHPGTHVRVVVRKVGPVEVEITVDYGPGFRTGLRHPLCRPECNASGFLIRDQHPHHHTSGVCGDPAETVDSSACKNDWGGNYEQRSSFRNSPLFTCAHASNLAGQAPHYGIANISRPALTANDRLHGS